MAEKILLVEDEEKLARMVEMELRYEGYEVTKAFDGRSGWRRPCPEVRPGAAGHHAAPSCLGWRCSAACGGESDLPVIMLTARDSVIDKVSGLDSGADDYITKPFAIEELLARIRAALRKRSSARAGAVLSAGPLEMDVDKHSVTVKGQGVELTKKEFDLPPPPVGEQGPGPLPGGPAGQRVGL